MLYPKTLCPAPSLQDEPMPTSLSQPLVLPATADIVPFSQNPLVLETDATVRGLMQGTEPALENDHCLDLLDRFLADDQLIAVAVVDAKSRPVGLMERGRMTEIFLKPYARDLHCRTPIRNLMNNQPVIVDIKTSLDDLAQVVINSGVRHMISGFIITENRLYAGLASGEAFLKKITQRKQEELFYLAHYDQLTGIANRLLFQDRLNQILALAKRRNEKFALGFIDLDKFKQINDSLGHALGDRLLITIAQRLKNSVRASDTVARLGGDEFVVILRQINSQSNAAKTVEKLLAALRQPVELDDTSIVPGASIGVALYPDHGQTHEQLIQNADAAMYQVKQQGRNGYLLFSEHYRSGLLEQITLETRLRSALANQELYLDYQPQIDLNTNRVIGVEALLRWRNPELGLVPPDKFIAIAEESHLILELGEWVLNEACRQHRIWLEQGLGPIRIAINIAPVQFHQTGFCDKVQAAVERVGVNPAYLELELTENIMMTDLEGITKVLQQLKKLGVSLAIDDFGTGYSNLGYLRHYPIDRIKIDQSFVRDIHQIKKKQALVKTIQTLGQHLEMEVIAEGIETRLELACVTACQCRFGQGYHFARPMSPEHIADYLTHTSTPTTSLTSA